MKNLLPFLAIILALLPSHICSQDKPNFVGEWYQSKAQGKTPVQADPFNRGQSDFARTKRYNLKANMNQLNSILNTKPELVNLVIPFGDETYTLHLSRTEILTEDFNVQTGKGQSRPSTGVQYRGIVNNNPEFIASMSLTKTDKSIYFSTAEGNIVIAREGNDFIIYNDKDQEMMQPLFCETLEADVEMPAPRMMALETGCKIVKVYFECDYALYQSKGSSVSNVSDYVMGFFNQVATLYANEGINIQVSQIYTWTTTDPYAALTTPSAIMNQFKATRGTNFNGNLAHFLTTRNVGGGIAYVDVICSKAYAYGVSRIYTTFSTVPTYSWTVNVVTHELGHNLGSPHTHSCSWSGGPIDNCHAVEGTCSPGPPPVNGGTIMSYCHTISAGINFNHGFGTQPGNLIRTKVQNATCLESGTGSPPASLTTTNITSTSATLNWAAVSGTSSYTAQYKLASASTWTPAGSTSSTSLNITGLTAATNYVWSVKADCSAFSTNASFTTTGSSGCPAPTQLISFNILQTGATLNWAAVTGATGYTVQYKPSTSGTWTSVNTTTNTTVLTGLTANTTYNWQVKANCSGYATAVNFTTTSSGCSAPGQLASTAITQTGATLTWGLVTGSTGYTVQYKPSSSSTWTTRTTTLNNLVLTGLTAGTTYQWQVKASCSGYSTVASFVTTSSTGCAAPANLTTTSITQTGATLSWGAVSGSTGYTIQYKTTPATTWTTVTSTTTSRAISGLTAGTSYVWQVKASCSSYSQQTSFTTTTSSGCSAPGQLSSSNITSSGAMLSWAAVVGATGYTLQYKTASASTWTTVASTTTSRNITGLAAGTAYVWQVKASCSVYSSQASFTTTSSGSGCTTPTNLAASAITSNAATLSWTGPSNGLTYSIRYRPIGFTGWTIRSGITGNSFRATGLISKRTYEWIINTQCSNGTSSSFSTPRQFTTL